MFQERKNEEINGKPPVIQIEDEAITISVEDDESVLLQGVQAVDQEDGDVSENIFIESISPFDEKGNRTVTYTAFDSDSMVTRAQRTIAYRDYQAPRFTLSGPLLYTLSDYSEDSLIQKIGAVSCVDGNISSKISANSNLGDSNNKISVSVTDSTGTSAYLDLTIESSLNLLSSNIDIQLKDYLIYVSQGTVIDPLDYITDIMLNHTSRLELLEEIDVDDNYQANEAGLYEFRYTINRANGDFGMTKLVVVVEE